MLKKILVILFVICTFLPVYAKRQSEEIITPMSKLQKRQFQTRTYTSTENKVLMKGILNVLQDEGFIVYNVNSLLGFIYGVKDFDTTDPNVDISREFGLSKSRLNYNGVKIAALEVAANITEYPDNIRVRINFKRKLLNQYGNAQFIDNVEDAEFYDDFYNKLNNAILLQKGTNKTNTVSDSEKESSVVKPSAIETEKTEEIKEDANEVEVSENKKEEKTEPPKQETKTEKEIIQQIKEETIEEQNDSAEEISQEEKIENQEENEHEELKIDKKQAKEQAKALKEQEKLQKELEKEQAKQAKEQEKLQKELEKEQVKQAKEQAKIEKKLNKINN